MQTKSSHLLDNCKKEIVLLSNCRNLSFERLTLCDRYENSDNYNLSVRRPTRDPLARFAGGIIGVVALSGYKALANSLDAVGTFARTYVSNCTATLRRNCAVRAALRTHTLEQPPPKYLASYSSTPKDTA